MAQARTVDITEIVDNSHFGSFQWQIALWCAALVAFDGFDNGVISFVAPVIAKEWQAGPASLGPVFSAGLSGLMLGALVSGPIADRYGRKRVVLASTLTFSIFALATVFAHSIIQLYILRFLTGIGVGGLMPNSIALMADYAPKRTRATIVAVMFLGFPLGAGAGGFLGAAVIPRFGWESMFLIGGILPLVLLPFASFQLPESIRFLVAHKRDTALVGSLLNRVTRTSEFSGDEEFIIADERTLSGFAAKHLFTEGRGINTALLWITFFCNLLVIYELASWLPIVLRDTGVPLESALRLGGMVPWAGIVGTIVLGPVVDRLGAPPVVAVLYVFAAGLIFAIGLAGADMTMLFLTVTGVGICVISGQSFINVISATIYPSPVRSTGVGWALGVGRVGAIVGPLIGGLLLAAHISSRNLFFTIAAPSLVAAMAMFVLWARGRDVEGGAAAKTALMSS